jgi:hypothetical protein
LHPRLAEVLKIIHDHGIVTFLSTNGQNLNDEKVLDALVTEKGRDGTMKARAGNYIGIVVDGIPRLGSSIRVLATGSNPFFVWARESSS